MKSSYVMKAMIGFYILLFFGYLFGPIIVMSITAFNTPAYPQAYPFESFTFDWFVKLWNDRMRSFSAIPAKRRRARSTARSGCGCARPTCRSSTWRSRRRTATRCSRSCRRSAAAL